MNKETESSQQSTPAQERRKFKLLSQLVNEGRLNSAVLTRHQGQQQIFPALSHEPQPQTPALDITPLETKHSAPQEIKAQVEFIKNPTEEAKKEEKEIQKTPNELTQIERRVYELISSKSEDSPISTRELVRQIWGPDFNIQEGSHRLSRHLSSLRKKLIGDEAEIININPPGSTKAGEYYVKKELEVKPKEDFIGEEDSDGKAQQEEVIGQPEPRYIPYVPSEEEKRSNVETVALDALLSRCLSSIKIRFEELQVALLTDVLDKRVVGIYSSQEIRELFDSAISKIMEEAKIPGLRELWSPQDEIVWGKVETAIKKIGEGNIESLKSKVKAMITRSEVNFYKDFPGQRRKVTKIVNPNL